MRGIEHHLFGIIGDPVGHSLSPRMHNAAFARLGLPYLYLPFHVQPHELRTFIRNMGRLGLTGVNVTIPHKETVIPWLDSLSKEARRIGAVNTVCLKGGRRIGHNTDGTGFLMALNRETGLNPRGKTALIFGAGGGARAVAFALARSGVKRLIVVNRTAKRAESLVRDVAGYFPSVRCKFFGLAHRVWQRDLGETDLLVQATSIGLIRGPGQSQSISLRWNDLKTGAVVCDLVTHPKETLFQKRALRRHHRTMGGLGMLLFQGALAFRLWTGQTAPLEAMETALKG